MLPYIDFDVIKNNPKVFMWYSDTTISHFICQKAWLVTFYWPSIMAGFGENWGLMNYMTESVHKTIFSNVIIGEVQANTDWRTSEHLDWSITENQNIKRKLLPNQPRRWIQWEGIASWKLLGGCVDVFPFMVWTTIWPTIEQRKDKILFLETSEDQISEEAFERIIRNFWSQGLLHVIKGIIVWRSQMDYSTEKQINYDDVLLKVVKWELCLSTLPIVTNLDFGHTDPMFVLPMGVEATLDSLNQTFSINESGCL